MMADFFRLDIGWLMADFFQVIAYFIFGNFLLSTSGGFQIVKVYFKI